jgi:hypothetical protein
VDRPLCLDLMIALSDAMVAQGLVNRPGELLRRYRLVVSTAACPLAASCRRRAGGRRFRPVQLSFWRVGRKVGEGLVEGWEFEAFR